MTMNEDAALDHRLRNGLHSLLLLAGMGLLLLLLGYLLWGGVGAVMAVLVGFGLVLFGPRVNPAMVLRLYRARPLGSYELVGLQQLLTALAQRAGLRAAPHLYYVPSRVMNAFSVGDRDQAAVGLTDGLLRNLSLRELTGVLAHEVSHIRNDDVRVMSLADSMSRLTSSLSFAGQLLLLVSLPMALLGLSHISWTAVLLLIAAPTLSALMQMALSRTREFAADVGAVSLTGDAVGLASALERLESYQHSFLEMIFLPGRGQAQPSILRTHPNTRERVARLRELVRPEPARLPRAPALHFDDARLLMPELFPAISTRPRWHLTGLWY